MFLTMFKSGNYAFAPIVLLWCTMPALSAASEYRAGTAVLDITPTEPIRLSGYGSRTKPSEGVLAPIHAKALAITRTRGRNEHVVIITTDLIGLPRAITDVVAARIQQKYGLERADILFNSSHTHTGPSIRSNLSLLFELPDAEQRTVDAYSDRLQEALFEVAGRAILDLAPATLTSGHGAVNFAVNRRVRGPNGFSIGVNPQGPTDSDVPVLRVTGADGKIKAVLFGYACHNTTLTGGNNLISGDYAGFAQEALERTNPGAIALFLMLSGADQNPNPRGTGELAKQHGATLATEVGRVLQGKMSPLAGALKAAFRIVELEFEANDKPTFESRLNDANPYRVRHAKAMLARIESGQPIRRYPYPVQAISFGGKFTLVALGGEVVVDYSLAIKRTYPTAGVVVAGYSNDVMAYIPSLRVLKEGGYEAFDSMYYYGLPASWAADTEEKILNTVATVIKATR
jgi:neutral ceramidase